MRMRGLIVAAIVGSFAGLAIAQPKQVRPPQTSQPVETRQRGRQPNALGRAAYYPNCNAARAAGAAPIYAGQPGYRAGLDRDGDGIACEPYRTR
jgi:hypothetical protein